MSTAFVRGPVAFEIMRAVTLKPSFSCARTRMGRPPARRTASENVGQYGDGIDHLVAAVEQGLADEVQGLLAADRDRDLFGRERDLEVLAVAHGHGGAQLGQAGRAGVARASGVEGGGGRLRDVFRAWAGRARPREKSRTALRRPCAGPPHAGPWPPSARPPGRAPGARGRARTRPARSASRPPPAALALGRRAPGTSRAGGARPPAAPARARRRRAGRPP